MALSVAYNTARSSLQASQSQMGVVSRNTSSATDPSYSRKIASLVTQNGSVRVSVARASSAALYAKMLETTSDASLRKSVLDGLERINQTIGDTYLNQSPAARVGALTSALQSYAKSPDNPVTARAFVASAYEMATSLNQASAKVQMVRQDADREMSDSVKLINDILVKFEAANNDVLRGTAVGADVSDSLDTRDALVAQLSEELGITVVTRAGNDMAIYTDGGVPLFERKARTVTFDRVTVGPVPPADRMIDANQVFIDGVRVTGHEASMPLNSGKLAGLSELRDGVAIAYEDQLHALAGGLIKALGSVFVEDPLAPARIAVNPAIDPNVGGSYDIIRDGGGNPDGDAAYSENLYRLIGELERKDRAFNSKLGLGATASLQEFASASASWVQASRQKASDQLDYEITLLGQASDLLSNATDVNMDDETAMMLQLEKSYAASAKLISVINEMLKTLLNMVG
ncbi:flagellar hook-associated protein FlgK [Microvirga massiliensis]|uniref:flagellar hook-associated protein FlgK n=1 Tax=Microvirga massiliensis TaxID=1033741 RepID=UPI00062BD281|nr:flagellar hook-associated protein FlgK [Microvirga massiliensis]